MSATLTKDYSSWLLGMFAKQPLPGLVKSRLARDSTPEWAAQVAHAFLRDLLDRLTPLPLRRVLVFAPAAARTFFTEVAAGRFELVPQSDGDLGTRLTCFLQEQFQSGAERIVLIGTDSPTLPREFVEQAFHALDDAEVVLGPATDGGYYLLGCRRFVPDLFRGVTWGSERVLSETVERVQVAGLRLALLPPWYDVDTLENWRMLRGHLAALRQAGLTTDLPQTEALDEP